MTSDTSALKEQASFPVLPLSRFQGTKAACIKHNSEIFTKIIATQARENE